MRSADELPAGEFSGWLTDIQRALRGEAGSDVPCNECTACCRSGQFIHIAPDETDTLSVIPRELLFPAPGQPDGHVVLGHDERGHCPMLVDNKCSIYDRRPRTCRTYDCRVFAASHVDAEGDVARQARRWRFRFGSPAAEREQRAVEKAASYLEAHQDVVRRAGLTTSATQLAVLAIELHDLFLDHDAAQTDLETVPDPETVKARLNET